MASPSHANPELAEQIRISEMPLADPLFGLYKEVALRARAESASVLLTGHWGDQVLGPLAALPAIHLMRFFRSLEAGDRLSYARLWRHWGKSVWRRPSAQRQHFFSLLTSRYHVHCLEWTFKMGQHLGIAIRSPFLDRDVIEFLLALRPQDFFIDGHKSLLRQALAEDLPANLVRRPSKADFSEVVRIWTGQLHGPLWRDFDAQALACWRQEF